MKKLLEIIYFRDGERQKTEIFEGAKIEVPRLVPMGDDQIEGK